MQNTSLLDRKLRAEGFSGQFNDMLCSHLRADGYSGQLNDMLFRKLRDSGYTGTLSEMLNSVAKEDYEPLFGFDLLALFADGANGILTDLSTAGMLYQTTAVQLLATQGNPVGLVLDRSQWTAPLASGPTAAEVLDPVLGPELVTNGSFNGGITGWTITNGGSATVDGSGYRITNVDTGASTISQSLVTEVGKRYFVSFGVLGFGGGATSGQIRIGTTAGAFNVEFSAQLVGSWPISFVATSTTTFVSVAANSGSIGAYGSYDNISVREIPGNHLAQTVSADRPTLDVTDGLTSLEFNGVNQHLKVNAQNVGTGVSYLACPILTTDTLGVILGHSSGARIGLFNSGDSLEISNGAGTPTFYVDGVEVADRGELYSALTLGGWKIFEATGLDLTSANWSLTNLAGYGGALFFEGRMGDLVLQHDYTPDEGTRSKIRTALLAGGV